MKTIREPATSAHGVAERPGTGDLDGIISGHPFLQGLNPHQMRIMRDCAMFIRFKAGELIFREGDPANRFYLIFRGKVAVESHVRDAGAMTIQTIGENEVLGWSWLFPPYYWHFGARAAADTEAVFFYGTPLREQCEADHDLGFALMKRLSEVMMARLQATRRQLVEMAARRGLPL
jgi:CRP/FNR family transcriptional regulator, cyclic AMP receptor protein